ncbi:unannotated protein [freshwater metagenome]|uniref:Unannotated protein n=1 Tax=freshwater metagenome TaxID=449393 RepID=A0A6J7IMI6_9ZZZZ|nr:hypothetical protein [Actinomycetota bacterium]
MRFLAPLLLAGALLAVPVAPASATLSTGAVRVRIKQDTTVVGFPSLTYHASISVLIPNSWRRTSSTSLAWGAGTGSCRYRVTISTRALAGPVTPGAVERLAAELPQTGARVLDSGVRDSRGSAQGESAWRVTRPSSIGSTLRVSGARTRRIWTAAGVLPTGQVVWSEIRLQARQLPGTECHSGTWREGIGPQMGDIFATAGQRAYVS